jgi:hypothetical protein
MTLAAATRTIVTVPKRVNVETTAPSVWLAIEAVPKTVGHKDERSVRLIELHAIAVVVVGRNLTKSTTRERAIVNETKVMKAFMIVAAWATVIEVTISVIILQASWIRRYLREEFGVRHLPLNKYERNNNEGRQIVEGHWAAIYLSFPFHCTLIRTEPSGNC